MTRGYLGDPEHTASAYVEIAGRRAYRTQDRGVIGEDGSLSIIGRMGAMVKVAGYRIDLGKVESAALRLPSVHLAGAFVHEAEAGVQELWMGVEPKDTASTFDVFAAKQELRKLLPAYMVPKRLLVFAELPRSLNGKLNRRALADRVNA